MTAPASVCGRSGPTMSGPMTSSDRTHDGKALRMLCIIDEFSRESLAIRVARKLKATDVIQTLSELFVSRGIPAHIRSDNGPEFVAEELRIGSLPSEPRPLTSNLEVHGRMAIARASTASCAMNCSTAIFLHIEGGTDCDRKLAPPLQHDASTLITRISTAGTRSPCLASTKGGSQHESLN